MARITLLLLSLTLCAVLVVAAPTRELRNEEDLLESVSLLDTQENSSRHYTSQDWDGDSYHGQQESFGTKQAAARDRKKAVAKANLIFDDDGSDDVSSSPNSDIGESASTQPGHMSYADFLKSAKDMSTTSKKSHTQKKRANAFQQLVKQGETSTKENMPGSNQPNKPNGQLAKHPVKQRVQKVKKIKMKRVNKQHAKMQRMAQQHAIKRNLGDTAQVAQHSEQHKAKKQRKTQQKGKRHFHSDLLEMGGSDSKSEQANPFDPTLLLEDSETDSAMSTAAIEGMLKKVEAAADRATKDESQKQHAALSTKALELKLKANKATNKKFAKRLAELEHTALEQA
jgi:hypothetical protein